MRQESWAFSAPEAADDLVFLRYQIGNDGAGPLSDLYAGLFLDLDIGTFTENTAGIDPDLGLAWITDPSSVHGGLCRLPAPGSPPPANLTVIHNPTYVWPQQYILDADKYAFLAALDPEHILAEGPEPDDYGVLASFGPFSMEPGEVVEINFAVLGGSSLEDLRVHAIAAGLIAGAGVTEVPEPENPPPTSLPSVTRLLPAAPNPFGGSTVLLLELSGPTRAELAVFDVAGRRVRTLLDASLPAGRHPVVWDGRDDRGRAAGAGVYFARLITDSGASSRRVVLLRR